MEKYVLTLADTAISEVEISRLLSLVPEEESDLIYEMAEKAKQIAAPKAVYSVVPIQEKGEDFVKIEGVSIRSPLMREKFDKINRVFPFVASCGTELEEWSNSLEDMLEQFWAEELKKIYLHKIGTELHRTIKEKYAPDSLLSSMNPGSLKEWALSGQRELFAILGTVKEDIGVVLTPSMLMLPSKAISGIYFLSESEYENCMLCPILDCPNRRAEYQYKKNKDEKE